MAEFGMKNKTEPFLVRLKTFEKFLLCPKYEIGSKKKNETKNKEALLFLKKKMIANWVQ